MGQPPEIPTHRGSRSVTQVTPVGSSGAGTAPSLDGGTAGVGGPAPSGATRRIEPPDRAELEQVRQRDPRALASFFDRYFDRIYGLVRRLLGDRELAEDVTSEVFLKVHRAAHRLDPSRDPGPWLIAIAYNACRDVWRSAAYRIGRRSSSLEGTPALVETLSAGIDEPERDLLRAEQKRLVQEAIQELPDPLRAAVVLHAYSGLGHEEIAKLQGIGHAAARKRYSRALEAMGQALREKLQ